MNSSCLYNHDDGFELFQVFLIKLKHRFEHENGVKVLRLVLTIEFPLKADH